LMFHYLRNNRWPSLHATIFRRNQAGERVCDFVFEPDFKKNWAVAFGAARPIVQLFTRMGLPFFIKFSGHSSPHIIVPGEALAISGKHEIKKQEFRMQVYRFVQSHMDNPGLLDGHSWNPTHFLRLPYSIHELGGKVSVPIRPEEFDSFNPDKARIENVKVIENWWDIPGDAVQRGREFIQQVTNIYPRLVSGIDKRELGHKWKPPDVPRKLRKFMDGNWYGKVTANGKQILASTAMPTANDLTARRILRNPSNKATINALELLNRWKNAGMEIDLKAASDVFEVNPLELQIRWQAQFTEQKIHPAYKYLYYSRTEIQEAFFHYAQGRCFSTKDGYFRIQQPSDIPLLAAYFDLNTKSRGFQCTKAIYRESDNQIEGCEIGILIDFSKSDYPSAVEMAHIIISVLQKYQVFCFVKFDGNLALEIIIPPEALPEFLDGQETALQMSQISSGIRRGLRSISAVRRNDCILTIQAYGHTYPAYSVNPETGLACIVFMPDDVQNFSPEQAELDQMSVNKEWFNIPGNVKLQSQRFLKYALSPDWQPT